MKRAFDQNSQKAQETKRKSMQTSKVRVAFAAVLLLVVATAGVFFYVYQKKVKEQKGKAGELVKTMDLYATCSLSEAKQDEQGRWFWEFSYTLAAIDPNGGDYRAAGSPLGGDPVTPEGQSQSYELYGLGDGNEYVLVGGNFYRYNRDTNTMDPKGYFNADVEFSVKWNGGSDGVVITANPKVELADTLKIAQPGNINLRLEGKGNLGGYFECQQNASLPTETPPTDSGPETFPPEPPPTSTTPPPTSTATCTEAGGTWSSDKFWQQFTNGAITAEIKLENGKAVATVVNNSNCKFPLSYSLYKVYDAKLSTQVIFGKTEAQDLSAGQTKVLELALPPCRAQIDVWYGQAVDKLVDDPVGSPSTYGWGRNPSVFKALVTQDSPCTNVVTNLTCTPSSQSVAAGTAANVTASGGTSPYIWTAVGATTANPSGASVSVTYSTSGTKTVTVKDSGNHEANCFVVVTVTQVNEPVICAPKTQSGTLGSVFNFTATKGDGTYTWTATGGSPASGTGSQFATTYNSAGSYTVKVSSDGKDDTCSVTVTSGGGGGGGQTLDISVVKDVTQAAVSVGGETNFIVVVKNLGNVSATGVVLDDLLPSQLTYQSHSVSQGTYDQTLGKWLVGSLAVGQSETLNMIVKVPSAGTFRNTATLTASTPADTNPANNSDWAEVSASSGGGGGGGGGGGSASLLCLPTAQTAVAGVNTSFYASGGSVPYAWTATGATPASGSGASFTTVFTAPGTYLVKVASGTSQSSCSVTVSGLVLPQLTDLELVKTVNKSQAALGEQVVFTLFVRNTSNVPASNVTVRDMLPAGLSYVSSFPAGSYDPYSNTWQIGNLLSGTTAVLQITVKANKVGSFVNQAEVWSAGPQDSDSSPGNGVTSEDDWDEVAVKVSSILPAAGSPMLPQAFAGGALFLLTLATALAGRPRKKHSAILLE